MNKNLTQKDFEKEADRQSEATNKAVEYLEANHLVYLPVEQKNLVVNSFAHGYYMGKKSNEKD